MSAYDSLKVHITEQGSLQEDPQADQNHKISYVLFTLKGEAGFSLSAWHFAKPGNLDSSSFFSS